MNTCQDHYVSYVNTFSFGLSRGQQTVLICRTTPVYVKITIIDLFFSVYEYEYEYEYFIQHKTYSTMFIAIQTTIYSEEQWLYKCFQKSMKVYLVVN